MGDPKNPAPHTSLPWLGLPTPGLDVIYLQIVARSVIEEWHALFRPVQVLLVEELKYRGTFLM